MTMPLWLMAQAAPGGAGGQLFQILTLVGPLFAIFYFLVWRPQQKQLDAKEKLLKSLEKGGKVIVAGGIHGTIREVKDSVLVVEVADKVRLTVQKDAVQSLITETAKAS